MNIKYYLEGEGFLNMSPPQQLRVMLKFIKIKEAVSVCHRSKFTIAGYRSNNKNRWPNVDVSNELIPKVKEYLIMKNFTIGEGGIVEKVESDNNDIDELIFRAAETLIRVQNRMVKINKEICSMTDELQDLSAKEIKFKYLLEGLRELKSFSN